MIFKYKLLFVIFPELTASNFDCFKNRILSFIFRFSSLVPVAELSNIEFDYLLSSSYYLNNRQDFQFSLHNWELFASDIRSALGQVSNSTNIHNLKTGLIRALYSPFWEQSEISSPFKPNYISISNHKFIIILGDIPSTDGELFSLFCSNLEELNFKFLDSTSTLNFFLSSDLKKELYSHLISLIWLNTNFKSIISPILLRMVKPIIFLDQFLFSSNFDSYILPTLYNCEFIVNDLIFNYRFYHSFIDFTSFYDLKISSNSYYPRYFSNEISNDMFLNILFYVSRSTGITFDHFYHSYDLKHSVFIFALFRLPLFELLRHFIFARSFYISHLPKLHAYSVENDFLVVIRFVDGFHSFAFLRYLSFSVAYCCILSLKPAYFDLSRFQNESLRLSFFHIPQNRNVVKSNQQISRHTLSHFYLFIAIPNILNYSIAKYDTLDWIEFDNVKNQNEDLTQLYFDIKTINDLALSGIEQILPSVPISKENVEYELKPGVKYSINESISFCCDQLSCLMNAQMEINAFILEVGLVIEKIFREVLKFDI